MGVNVGAVHTVTFAVGSALAAGAGALLGPVFLVTPTMGDPRQARMMLFMPVVFTFMFLNLPSGLVLYWTVSNVLQILQQKLMDRPARTRPAHEAKDAGRA